MQRECRRRLVGGDAIVSIDDDGNLARLIADRNIWMVRFADCPNLAEDDARIGHLEVARKRRSDVCGVWLIRPC
jgi:hypothetical protein